MNKIDLHMHTQISDGTDTLEELLVHVQEAGLDLFSVTDHDAIKAGSLMPAMLEKNRQAQQAPGTPTHTAATQNAPAPGDPNSQGGRRQSEHFSTQRPGFIRGVEFSCRDEEGKYHILGYGYDPEVPGIAEVVEHGHQLRMKKTQARLDFLQEEFGFDFPEEDVQEILAMENPGKPHIAKMMIRLGYAETIQGAMSEYINKRKFHNAHVRPEEAIEGILKSNGIPVLAHPAYGDGDDLIIGDELEERIKRLMGFGLQGVEAYYSGFTPVIQNGVLSLAEKYDLYVTAGSDYHGGNKMIELGWTNLEDMSEAPEQLLRFLDDVEIL